MAEQMQIQLEVIDCPICGIGESREVLRARDLKLFCPGEFRLVACHRCGLIYMNPRPAAADMGRYYPAHYWAPPPPSEAPPYLDAGMRRTLAALVRDYPGGRVLDVGCGIGRIPALMRERGLQAMGLEPYEHACQIAREHYGVEAVNAFLRDADLPEGSFDAVTMFDVLEHVHDPLGDLRRVHSLLRPGGALFVKVPNIASLQAELCGKWWYCLDIPRHLLHFSPRSLRQALKAAGFARVNCAAVPDSVGALVFETTVVYRLRDWLLARRGVEVAPAEGQTVGEVLEGEVYAGVPWQAKRVFRWLVRNVFYAPLAVENLVGRSVELLAVARR